MSYASQLDLENAYGAQLVTVLSDHDDDGVADPEPIADAMQAASSIIDAYLSVRYPTPIQNPPQVVKDLTVDIGLYRLAYSRLKQTDEMRKRYDDAIQLLKDIVAGKASIGLDTDDDGISDDQPGSVFGRTRFLSRA
jgi:phage gp36-like protein